MPDDFSQVMEITSPDTKDDAYLDYVAPYRMANESEPYFYSIQGSTILLPTGIGSVVMNYIANFPELSESNLTNWLTDNAYDVLLYGSLSHAEGYLVNDARVALWNGAYEQGINEIIAEDDKARTSGNALRVI
ncbi:unnamed protein product [marine sediment metagenome]|uniref:Uncharacterized protein n=1 Tax=marine sediment metagenome TaxID=412755 RepID=X0Z8M2_9ZZZZ